MASMLSKMCEGIWNHYGWDQWRRYSWFCFFRQGSYYARMRSCSPPMFSVVTFYVNNLAQNLDYLAKGKERRRRLRRGPINSRYRKSVLPSLWRPASLGSLISGTNCRSCGLLEFNGPIGCSALLSLSREHAARSSCHVAGVSKCIYRGPRSTSSYCSVLATWICLFSMCFIRWTRLQTR